MILVDTGPWVALFDPKDGSHRLAKQTLETIREPLVTTIPVLTEAFHLLDPGSRGAKALATFLRRGGSKVWYLSDRALERSLELMDRWSDKPMDLADASIVAAGEALGITSVFTIDRRDFTAYRVRRGKRLASFKLIP